MTPEQRAEVEAALAEALAGIGDAVDASVRIDPYTGRLAEHEADALDARLPAWIRVDREHDVREDGHVRVLIDPVAAALDPSGRSFLAALERSGQ